MKKVFENFVHYSVERRSYTWWISWWFSVRQCFQFK